MRRTWLIAALLLLLAACGDDDGSPFTTATTAPPETTVTTAPTTTVPTTTLATTTTAATTTTTAAATTTLPEPELLSSGEAVIVRDGAWYNVHEGRAGEGGSLGIVGPNVEWAGGLALMPGTTPPGYAGCLHFVGGTQLFPDVALSSIPVGAYLCLQPYPYGATEIYVLEVGSDYLAFAYRTWPTTPTD